MLFHITPHRNLACIFMQGLGWNDHRPGFTYTSDRRDRPRKVYLTDSVEFVVQNQLTEEWVREHNPIVLRVYQAEGLRQESEHEFVCDYVSPAHVVLLGTLSHSFY